MTELLSPSEIEMISKRIAIAVLLETGSDYREIQQILKVSKGSIAKVNNLYRYNEGLRELIARFVKEEQIKEPQKHYSLNQVATDIGLEIRKAVASD